MKAGQINHKSRWIKFLKENKDEKALIEMMDPNQYGSSAHELFEDLMDGIREYHKQFKTQIKQHFKSASFRMVAETTQ
jgi:transcription termination factor NusB